ncbi:MAG: demethoxyubiquinone hydroxylase family protein [Rickettsiales bacterium]
MQAERTRRLPGDVRADAHAALRVDHAGEYGAQRIYAGQLAVLKHDACAPEIRHMAAQEQVHLAAFNRLLPEHGVRPTALLPLWHVLGFALGAASARIGPKAAMACTVAVETVIAEHYQKQLDDGVLPGGEVTDLVRQFRGEELEHHAIGLAHDAESAPFYGPLSLAVQGICRAAIRLSSIL